MTLYVTKNGIPFKTHELFVSEISHFVFSDSSRPQGSKPQTVKPQIRGDHCTHDPKAGESLIKSVEPTRSAVFNSTSHMGQLISGWVLLQVTPIL